MKKRTLALALALLPFAAAAQVVDETGATGAFTPDRIRTATLGALDAAVTIEAAGRSGLGGYLAIGTLSGTTITPEVTLDGSTWVATSFLTWSAGAAPARAATITATTLFQIEIPAGAKQARIRISTYGSGSGTGTLIATALPGVQGVTAAQPVSGTVTVTEPVSVDDNAGSLTVDGTVSVTEPVSVDDNAGSLTVDAASWPLPTGAATAANQLPDGHNVTVDNAGAGAAVNIQDGGNSITVDGTVGVSGAVDTELPAAVALGDNTANPTAPAAGTFIHAWDGTNWDRLQTGAATGGALKVDGSAVTQPVSGTVSVTEPVSVDDNAGSLTVDGTVSISGAVDTELPSAAALGDNTANPTAPAGACHLMLWDGANWDRALSGGGIQSVSLFDATVDFGSASAAISSDDQSAPVTQTIYGFGMVFDGLTWDRMRGTSADGLLANTELPAAAALGDNTANPTAPAAGVFLHAWDGTNWDRLQTAQTTGGALKVEGDRVAAANNDGACVSVTTSSTTVLASFTTRASASIVNRGTDVVYIKLGATATSSDFPLDPLAAYNIPTGTATYTGVIDGIAASGTQSVCVVEF